MKKNLSTTMLEENIASAEHIITKWDLDTSASLFSSSSPDEARDFLSAITGLKHAMNLHVSHRSSPSNPQLLSRAHHLIESAMARLQKEFHRILATAGKNCTLDQADPSREETGIAMDDLRSIGECMMACGYSKECVKLYTTVRHSIIEEGLHRLGFIRTSTSHFHKLDWDTAERQIRSWVTGSRSAVRTIFREERFLCDHVFFSSSDSVKDAIFAEITKEPAIQYLRFPETVTSKTKNSPEKIFPFLDMHDSISELTPEIESLFHCHKTAVVPVQARSSLAKLGEFIRHSLADFETAIEKESLKGLVPGGGLHPLTRYVMNYLTLLADYTHILGDIITDHDHSSHRKPLPEPFAKLVRPVPTAPSTPTSLSDDETEVVVVSPVLSSRVAWIVLHLLCKLDKKAETYRDAPLSYLFLANNVRYVVEKVSKCRLRQLLGEEWVEKHEEKARGFARSYERLGWRKVVEAIPSDPLGLVESGGVEAVVERLVAFDVAFEEACRRQSGWAVTDTKMREELKVSIAGMVLAPYRELYESCLGVVEGVVRFTPEDVGKCLSDLFCEEVARPVASVSSDGSSESGHGSSSESWRGRWRFG